MKSVGEARPPEIAKYSATTAASVVAPTVVKSVGEARPPEIAKYSATTAASVVAPTVVKSVGEARFFQRLRSTAPRQLLQLSHQQS